jgi:hypothetical protein
MAGLVVAVILARPKVAGATEVLAGLSAPGSIGRAVARAAIPHMTVAALNPKIAADLVTGEIADQAASDEADRTCDDGPGNSTYGRARCPVVCAGARGHEDDCDGHEGKSTKRAHVFPPSGLPTRKPQQGTAAYLGPQHSGRVEQLYSFNADLASSAAQRSTTAPPHDVACRVELG